MQLNTVFKAKKVMQVGNSVSGWKYAKLSLNSLFHGSILKKYYKCRLETKIFVVIKNVHVNK